MLECEYIATCILRTYVSKKFNYFTNFPPKYATQ